jgi:predicted Zn-dependent protease
LFGYNKATNGEFTVTARTADGKGSGYGVSYFIDAAKLDTKAATEVAIQKALASKEAKELKPERLTVILEPQAVNDLMTFLLSAMDARNADEGRSFFGNVVAATASAASYLAIKSLLFPTLLMLIILPVRLPLMAVRKAK